MKGDFEIPDFLSRSSIDLLKGILCTNPDYRLTISKIRSHPWVLSKMPRKPKPAPQRAAIINKTVQVFPSPTSLIQTDAAPNAAAAGGSGKNAEVAARAKGAVDRRSSVGTAEKKAQQSSKPQKPSATALSMNKTTVVKTVTADLNKTSGASGNNIRLKSATPKA